MHERKRGKCLATEVKRKMVLLFPNKNMFSIYLKKQGCQEKVILTILEKYKSYGAYTQNKLVKVTIEAPRNHYKE